MVVSANKRQQLGLLFGWRCAYCGRQLTANNFTVDHVVPKALGGDSDSKNLLPCCKQCNGTKGDMPLEDYRNVWLGVINSFMERCGKPKINLEDVFFYFEKQDQKKYLTNGKIKFLLAMCDSLENTNSKNFSRAPKIAAADRSNAVFTEFISEIRHWQDSIDVQIAELTKNRDTGDSAASCVVTDSDGKMLSKIKNQNTTYLAEIASLRKRISSLASKVNILEGKVSSKKQSAV